MDEEQKNLREAAKKAKKPFIEIELKYPVYSDFFESIKYMYLLALGEFGFDDFELGNGDQGKWLWLYFEIASFVILVHLMNMLIAVMGETFSSNNEIKDRLKTQSHLRFVVDNLWMDAIKDKEKITYLIAAFEKKEEDEDVEMLKELRDDQVELAKNLKSSFFQRQLSSTLSFPYL